ncbi:glycosyltransferase [Vibrio maritimus]|uniref:glycosyltransferase n=1 Tax=Vibrio maritimus TaxID=990268 RepID=UPI001F33B54B|nr:glycosyltransferase [Vibrio maritimus]
MSQIGYVLSDFPVLSETFVGTEIRAMKALGHSIQPMAFRLNPNGGQPIDDELARSATELSAVSTKHAMVEWLKNPVRSIKALSFIMRQRNLPKKSLIRSTGQLAASARTTKCHHLHAHFALHTAATAIAAAKLTGCNVSFVGHGYDVYSHPADLALKLSNVSFSVAVCKEMQSKFQTLNQSKKVHLVECGIDLARYPFKPTLSHNGKLLFIGRLTEKKGLTDLLYALSLIPEESRPSLDLVGDGEQKHELLTLTKQLNLNDYVSFLGSQPSEWIIDHANQYLALCTPFCEAKNGDRDTGPVVVKEAMALGLPVVSSDFMGCKEMISPDTGLLFSPHDIQALSDAISQINQQPSQQRLAQLKRARERVETYFSAHSSAQKLSSAIRGAAQ